MKHLYCLMALMLSLPEVLSSQNPVINHCFTADPTARVFNDKIYVSIARYSKPGGTSEGVVLHGGLSCVFFRKPCRLDGPRRNTLAGACALGRARVLLHVGARLRV